MEAVKILTEHRFDFYYSHKEGGNKKENPQWHLGVEEASTFRTFCEGEAYGIGDSNCEYEVKSLRVQKITCPKCIDKINRIKKVKTQP